MLAWRTAGKGNFLLEVPFSTKEEKAGGTMSDKPFMRYDQMIDKLRDEKKLTISEGTEDETIALLKKYSYFSLVSGYKNLFKTPDGTYIEGTTINDIVALYEFDDKLRNIFFRAIQIVEKHIKSLLSYAFVNQFGEEQSNYMSPLNYDSLPGSKYEINRQAEIKKLISTFVGVVTPPSDHKYISHQWNKHKNVPLWVSVKALTFGNISKMYSLCYPSVQSEVAKEFADVTAGTMAGMLDMLTRVRNVCAHNERLYDFAVKNSRSIQDMPVHATLGIAKSAAGLYNQGKCDLFAALICLRYLLDQGDFQEVVDSINLALTDLHEQTKMIHANKMLSCMGFPENWTDIQGKEEQSA